MKKLLIVGLGNPGSKYLNTRHNIGFILIDKLIESFNLKLKNYFTYELAEYVNVEEKFKIFFLKPLNFMNLSGISVLKIKKQQSISSDSVLIVHDDLDFDFLITKMKFSGGTAGHKGLESITDEIKTYDYYRLRIGISRPKDKNFISISDYVLSKFSEDEFKKIEEFVPMFLKKVDLWIKEKTARKVD